MGLDSVELVLEIEEQFGIELKDEEVTTTNTPRKVGDLVFSKLKATDESICQSQRAFYILRNAFIKIFKLDRKSITPDMKFRNLIPETREKDIWQQIKLAVAARNWPKLSRPLWMLRLFTLIKIVIFFGTIFAWIYYAHDNIHVYHHYLSLIIFAMFFGCLLVIVFEKIAEYLTIDSTLYIPSEFNSIRDIIPYVITSEHIKWTREQVSERLKIIIMDVLPVSESDYTEDSDFVKDFNLD